jgi:hypothetical protein
MKYVLFIAMLLGLSINGFSQEKEQSASVEKMVFGIQTGFAGIWVHGEFRLSNKFALRTEIGLDLGIWENNYTNESGLAFAPVITLEPRFYYNLKKRLAKGKRIDGNSGNFIALKTSYNSDLFFIGTSEDIHLEADFMIIPTWGIRRNISQHFNYEAGFGLGYIHYKEEYYNANNSDVAVNIHARIGYKF